jgi:hypothetical protein
MKEHRAVIESRPMLYLLKENKDPARENAVSSIILRLRGERSAEDDINRPTLSCCHWNL